MDQQVVKTLNSNHHALVRCAGRAMMVDLTKAGNEISQAFVHCTSDARDDTFLRYPNKGIAFGDLPLLSQYRLLRSRVHDV